MNRLAIPTEGVFRTRLRARFAETDLQGVVHHSVYLIYFEQARVEYFKSLGFDFRQSRQNGDFDIIIAEAHCKYLAPAEFDDELEILVWTSHVRRASFTIDYCIRRGETLIAYGQTVQAAIDPRTGRPRSLPAAMHRVLLAQAQCPTCQRP
ncbi:MAG: acyl-CoA thioesterase [Candidatus Bipolaricaulota bacterium]|nr:acyl-CoA thioesterase [Candidatus Bipolaricaulota bacterium]